MINCLGGDLISTLGKLIILTDQYMSPVELEYMSPNRAL